MLLENEEVFKQEYLKLLGKDLPANVLFVEQLKYQNGKLKFYLRTQFVITLNQSFHNGDISELHLQRWNSNDGLSSVVCYEQEYTFYSNEKSETLIKMHTHIEEIVKNIESRMTGVKSVYAFFKVIS